MAATIIRPGVRQDIREVLALEREVHEAPRWPEADYEVILEPAAASAVLRVLLIAESEKRICGFAVVKLIAATRTAELESLAVSLRSRRRGIGRSLCEAAIDWSRSRAAETMDLEVRSANEAARRLYERLGFIVVGIRELYYRHPEDDAVLMRLNFERCG